MNIYPNIIGSLDIYNNGWLEGWALRPDAPDERLRLEVFIDGVLTVTDVADRYRKDLENAAAGDAKHAFRIPVPTKFCDNGFYDVDVRYAGTDVALPGCPRILQFHQKKSLCEGRLDFIDYPEVCGWAWDANNPDAIMTVDIFADDIHLFSTQADRYREDLNIAGIGNKGFIARIPHLPESSGTYAIRARLQGADADLENSPLLIRVNARHCYKGRLEVVNYREIKGWAWNEANPTETLKIDIIINHKQVARIPADEYRSDLRRAGIGDGRKAFQLKFAEPLDPSQEYKVQARITGVDVSLNGSPRSLTRSMREPEIIRTYPHISPIFSRPIRPVSFIVVRFSDSFDSIFCNSELDSCPENQTIVVENTSNIYFPNLTHAILDGIEKTKNDIIVFVHEDVLLTAHWQACFEHSLNQLESHDPNWGMICAVGWSSEQKIIGHWSDSTGYRNCFSEDQIFEEVFQPHEQLIAFHKNRIPYLDPQIPGFHHLGLHLAYQFKFKGLKVYAIDAPTVHKLTERAGKLIPIPRSREEVMDGDSMGYLADKTLCDEYVKRLFPFAPLKGFQPLPESYTCSEEKEQQLDQPLILVSRGGSGSRLLSEMALDLEIFLGDELNDSCDSVGMIQSIYQSVITKYSRTNVWRSGNIIRKLRASAAQMIDRLSLNRFWGFKVPESVFLLDELEQAFPKALYVHLIRDPLTTCLRRTHITARLDNHIGRITLPLAYEQLGIPKNRILIDSPALHMAYTTIHQLGLIEVSFGRIGSSRQLTLRFENLLDQPIIETSRLAQWLNLDVENPNWHKAIDLHRAINPKTTYPEETKNQVCNLLRDSRIRWGYS